jgi:hypothetical protein
MIKKHAHKHTISTNPITYLRILFVAVASYLTVYFYVDLGVELQTHFQFHALNIGVLYAILIGFMISEIITRRHNLDDYVALELNKIRRIYHLSKHLSRANPALGVWFKNIKISMKDYIHFFEKESFINYEQASPRFRVLTYNIYGIPQEHLQTGEALYSALLDTTADATEAREFIRSSLKNRYIGNFAWLIILLVTVTFALTLAGSTPDSALPRFATMFVIFNLFLILQLIFEYGRISKRKAESYAAEYLNNLQRLEWSK